MPRGAMLRALLCTVFLAGCSSSASLVEGPVLPQVVYRKGLDAEVVRVPQLKPAKGRAEFTVDLWFDRGYWGARYRTAFSRAMFFEWEVVDPGGQPGMAMDLYFVRPNNNPLNRGHANGSEHARIAISPEGVVRRIRFNASPAGPASALPEAGAGGRDRERQVRAVANLLVYRLGKREFRQVESLGRFGVPIEDLVQGMQGLRPETIYAGMRIVQGREALVFVYAGESVHHQLKASIQGYYAVDKDNLRRLAGESNLTLSHKNMLVFFERAVLRSEID